ncbi:MAG: hypothetical protein ACTSPB_01805 [Candidatus Thorarchaeota archaeon]
MSLPTPINWLQERTILTRPPAPVAAPIEEEKTLMLFHTDTFFDDDNEMASVIEWCVFHSTAEDDITYEGIIKESDREKVQEFFVAEGNYDFRAFAEPYEELQFGQSPNWVWITDTLMNLCDKVEFSDQSNSKDVRFWMLVQNYEYEMFDSEGELFGQHYDRRGRSHVVLIETKNLSNWEPIARENMEITKQDGSVQDFDLPRWIYEAFEDDEDYI